MTGHGENRRILRNIISTFSTWIFPLFFALIVTRIVVRSLGHTDYGIYAFVFGFVGYSFNFSLSRAITKYLATYRAAGETEKIRSMISATASITLLVGLVGFLAIVLMSHWLVIDIFGFDRSAQLKAIRAMQVSAATVFVLMLSQIATAVLQGLHRFDVFSKIQILNNLLMMLGNFWLAYNGYGLVALLYWNLGATTVTGVIAYLSAKRLLPELSFTFDFSKEVLKTVARYTAGVVGYQIAGNAFFILERSWIIAKLGAEALTFYVIPMTIGMYLHAFVSSLVMVLFPLASELDGDTERLVRLYRVATKSVLFVTSIVAVSLIVEGRLFLLLWMGPDFAEHSSEILILQTVAFGMAAVSTVSFQTAEGLGMPGFNFRNTLFGVLLSLPLIFGLTDQVGSVAVAAGRIVLFAGLFLGIFDLERRRLGGFRLDFWLGILLRFGVSAISAAVVETTVIATHMPGWTTFIVATISGCVVYLTVCWFIGVASADDRVLISRLFHRQG